MVTAIEQAYRQVVDLPQGLGIVRPKRSLGVGQGLAKLAQGADSRLGSVEFR